MRKSLISIALISLSLISCHNVADKKAAIEYLCAYQQQLMALNDGMVPFKEITMRNTYRMLNSGDDQSVRNLCTDSILAAQQTYLLVLDQSIADMRKIKKIGDKSMLVEKSLDDLGNLQAFFKNDFKGFCLEARDSLTSQGPWKEKWLASFKQILSTGNNFPAYQLAFGNEYKLTDDDLEAVVKCEDKKYK